MAPKAGFDQRFRKVIGQMSSDNQAERHTACDLACKMSEDSGLHFYEAVEKVFGVAGGNEDLIEARDFIEKLEEQRQRLEAENRTLKEGVELLQQKVEQMGERRTEIREGAQLEFIEEVWSYPQARLTGLFLIVCIGMWIRVSFLYRDYHHWVFWMFEILISIMVLTEISDWLEAEYCRSGAGVSILRLPIVLSGIYGVLAAFFGDIDVLMWSKSIPNLTAGVTTAVLVTIITVSKICPWLADTLAHSNKAPMKTLRQWFA